METFIGADECQLSYNPLLMALLWESLATREVKLLQVSMRERFSIGPCCAWVNYVRSHDDIGWTFDDVAAARLGMDGFAHRQFLNAFYTGRFPGSFARGLPFQENPRTGDAVTLYDVIEEPPCDAGVANVTIAPPLAHVTLRTRLFVLSAT